MFICLPIEQKRTIFYIICNISNAKFEFFERGIVMKRKHFLLSTLVLFASVSILILWSYREQALSSLLSSEGIPKYISIGYYDGMEESHIVGAISEESIADLLYSTTVRKGTSYRAMPSPCFEITVIYSNETYRVIVWSAPTITRYLWLLLGNLIPEHFGLI